MLSKKPKLAEREPLIPLHGGYRKLKSFQIGQLIYDLTVRFCDIYIPPRSRTHDQMVQAARSGVQNIAEGSQASGTSKKFELKLTNVARASLEELRLDFEDFLRQRNLPQWPPDHPALKRFKAKRCATMEQLRQWVREERRLLKDTNQHGQPRTNTGVPVGASPCQSVLVANAALSLLNLCCYLLDRQLAAQAATFEKEGGFTERLHRIRTARKYSAAAILLGTALSALAQFGPDPIFEKPAPLTMAELEKLQIHGVEATEVKDFAYPGYKGGFKPSPPHADLNPQKAVIISWGKGPQKFVFSHEASYCPWMQMPNGLGLSTQFFEGNNGWAELFNNNGRKTRNSFVDIIQSGPRRSWVRWNYFCVNAGDDSKPALRGTEDYIAYPNGLVWRRLSYESLMPEKLEGYSWQPVDFFAPVPPGVSWEKLVRQDAQLGDYHVAAILDAASEEEYDLFFSAPGPGRQDPGCGHPRRNGDNARLRRIAQSPLGFAMVMPCQGAMPFIIFGNASGFDRTKSQLVDHSFNDTGGDGWTQTEWDHWPVAWINSQGHTREPDSPYPYHFGPMSHYIVTPPLTNGPVDYFVRTKDMDLNRWSEKHVYYAILGVGKDFESIRKLARQWLEKGAKCANPDDMGKLRWQ